MKRKFLYSVICLFVFASMVFAYGYIPDFTKMRELRCDFEETIYNQDNSIVTQNNRFKIFKLDDTNKKIFIHKEPIDKVTYYENDRIEFTLQSMTDEFIEMTNTVIDRNTFQYSSTSTINYDNLNFGTRYSKSTGTCCYLN